MFFFGGGNKAFSIQIMQNESNQISKSTIASWVIRPFAVGTTKKRWAFLFMDMELLIKEASLGSLSSNGSSSLTKYKEVRFDILRWLMEDISTPRLSWGCTRRRSLRRRLMDMWWMSGAFWKTRSCSNVTVDRLKGDMASFKLPRFWHWEIATCNSVATRFVYPLRSK